MGKHENHEKLWKLNATIIRTNELKRELNSLTEDIVQHIAGEDISDIEDRKARFMDLHDELRRLQGKEPRNRRGK